MTTEPREYFPINLSANLSVMAALGINLFQCDGEALILPQFILNLVFFFKGPTKNQLLNHIPPILFKEKVQKISMVIPKRHSKFFFTSETMTFLDLQQLVASKRDGKFTSIGPSIWDAIKTGSLPN